MSVHYKHLAEFVLFLALFRVLSGPRGSAFWAMLLLAAAQVWRCAMGVWPGE